MSIFSALLRTVTAPVEITVRAIASLPNNDGGKLPVIGDVLSATVKTAKAIKEEFEE